MATATRTTLSIQPREERGSRASRRLRGQGLVPGVVYGRGDETIPFKVDGRSLRAVLAEGHALFDVELDGAGREPVIIKDQQHDPVQGNVIHLDLLRVRLDEKIQATVLLELEGTEEAPGVKEGGVLGHVTREIVVEALPTDIPDQIITDVSGLSIGETLTLDRVSTPPGVELVGENFEETVVATVTAPSKIEEPEVIEEEAELVGEEGEVPEGEAPPEEGAKPAEGEGAKPAEAGGEGAKQEGG